MEVKHFANAEDIIREVSEDITYAGEVLPTFLLLDASGSMRNRFQGDKTRWEVLVENTRELIRHIQAQEELAYSVHITIATFNRDMTIICENKLVADLDAEELERTLRRITPNGTTALGRCTVKAIDMLNEYKRKLAAASVEYYQPLAVIISDGEPSNDAGEPSVQSMSQAYALADKLIADGKLTILPLGIASADTAPSEFTALSRLIKEEVDDGYHVPVLTNAEQVRANFRLLAQTIIVLSSGGNAEDIRSRSMREMGYTLTDSMLD